MKRKIIKVAKNCIFCKEDKLPYYKDVAVLSKYVSERGRLMGRDRTGICSKHQRILTIEVKRARHLALLPFVAGL